MELICGAEQQGYTVKLFSDNSDKIPIWEKRYEAMEGKWIKDIYSILKYFLTEEDSFNQQYTDI